MRFQTKYRLYPCLGMAQNMLTMFTQSIESVHAEVWRKFYTFLTVRSSSKGITKYQVRLGQVLHLSDCLYKCSTLPNCLVKLPKHCQVFENVLHLSDCLGKLQKHCQVFKNVLNLSDCLGELKGCVKQFYRLCNGFGHYLEFNRCVKQF